MRSFKYSSDDNREHLFHYTGQSGMFGVLETGNVFASKFSFLNDSSEFKHGFQTVLSEIYERAKKGRYGTIGLEFHEKLKENLGSLDNINICVCSWSEWPTRLSLWRAYSNEAQGYAFSFPKEALREVAAAHGFKLGRCIYDDVEQRSLVAKTIDEWELGLAKSLSEFSHVPVGEVSRLVSRVVMDVPFLKNRAFSEEREWRMVSRPISFDHPRYLVRPGLSCPIPYYSFPLSEISSQISVVVGPGPMQIQASEAIHVLCSKSDSKFSWNSIRFDHIPFRGGS